MVTGYMRGHKIYFDGFWRYSDTKGLALDNRQCMRCGKYPTPEGYDACIGHVEGATAACCGHGVGKPYVVMEVND